MPVLRNRIYQATTDERLREYIRDDVGVLENRLSEFQANKKIELKILLEIMDMLLSYPGFEESELAKTRYVIIDTPPPAPKRPRPDKML